jgi:hypothetical protein
MRMTSRSFDGVGSYTPSFSSNTPIYDRLVAERGVPQIAPINVPPALPPAPSYGGGYDPLAGSSGGNLPALARPALGPGPSSPGYGQPGGYYGGGPQQLSPVQPQPFVPSQQGPGGPGMPPGYGPGPGPQYGGQPSFGGNGLRPTAPVAPVRPMQQRPAPAAPQGGYYGDQYPRGGQQGY